MSAHFDRPRRAGQPYNDAQVVHVAPLPAGHAESIDCWCQPIESIRVGFGDGSARLYIHRTSGDRDPALEARESP